MSHLDSLLHIKIPPLIFAVHILYSCLYSCSPPSHFAVFIVYHFFLSSIHCITPHPPPFFCCSSLPHSPTYTQTHSSCPSLTSVTLPIEPELRPRFPGVSFPPGPPPPQPPHRTPRFPKSPAPHPPPPTHPISPSHAAAAGAPAACIISGCRSEGNPAPLPRRRQSPACPFMARGYPPSLPDAAHVWAATKLEVGGIPLAATVQ